MTAALTLIPLCNLEAAARTYRIRFLRSAGILALESGQLITTGLLGELLDEWIETKEIAT